MIYYLNTALLTFVFGCLIYIYGKDLKDKMGISMFLFLNFVVSLFFFLTWPFVIYLSFFKKEKANE